MSYEVYRAVPSDTHILYNIMLYWIYVPYRMELIELLLRSGADRNAVALDGKNGYQVCHTAQPLR